MDITTGDVIQFFVTYKWWLIAIIPFAIAIMVIKARG